MEKVHYMPVDKITIGCPFSNSETIDKSSHLQWKEDRDIT